MWVHVHMRKRVCVCISCFTENYSEGLVFNTTHCPVQALQNSGASIPHRHLVSIFPRDAAESVNTSKAEHVIQGLLGSRRSICRRIPLCGTILEKPRTKMDDSWRINSFADKVGNGNASFWEVFKIISLIYFLFPCNNLRLSTRTFLLFVEQW